MRFSKSATLAVAVASALLLAACGSDSSGGSSTKATDAQGAGPKLTGAPIKIGQIVPTGTSIYNAPDSLAVAKAAVRGVNKRGGIKGRPLELVYCNDKADANQAVACGRQLVSKKVVASVRSVIVANGGQVAEILGQAKIPTIGLAALTPAEFSNPNSYLLDGGVLYAYAADLKKLADDGGKTVFLTVIDSPSADPTVKGLTKIAERLGLKVVGTQKIQYTTADFAPLAANISRSKADAAVLALTEQTIVQTIKAADQTGVKVKWLLNGGGLNSKDFKSLPAPQTANMIIGLGTKPLSATDDPAVAEMKSDIDAEFASGDQDANPEKLFGNALIAWGAINAFVNVAKGLPTINAATVKAALDKATEVPVGVSVPWTPSKAGPADYPRVSHPFVYACDVKDNNYHLTSKTPVDLTDIVK